MNINISGIINCKGKLNIMDTNIIIKMLMYNIWENYLTFVNSLLKEYINYNQWIKIYFQIR